MTFLLLLIWLFIILLWFQIIPIWNYLVIIYFVFFIFFNNNIIMIILILMWFLSKLIIGRCIYIEINFLIILKQISFQFNLNIIIWNLILIIIWQTCKLRIFYFLMVFTVYKIINCYYFIIFILNQFIFIFLCLFFRKRRKSVLLVWLSAEICFSFAMSLF